MSTRGPTAARAQNHGLPRFREATFATAYPFGRLELRDADVPVGVDLEAFNLSSDRLAASSWPVAVLRFVVTNRERRRWPCRGRIAAELHRPRRYYRCCRRQLQHHASGEDAQPAGLQSARRACCSAAGGRSRGPSIRVHRAGRARREDVTAGPAGRIAPGVTACSTSGTTSAPTAAWTSEPANPRHRSPRSRTGVRRRRRTERFTFLLGWHFPNRRAWEKPEIVGNYYTTLLDDAWTMLAGSPRSSTSWSSYRCLRQRLPRAICRAGQRGGALQPEHAAHADRLPDAGWRSSAGKAVPKHHHGRLPRRDSAAHSGNPARRDRHHSQVRDGDPRRSRSARDPAADTGRTHPWPAREASSSARSMTPRRVTGVVLAGGHRAASGATSSPSASMAAPSSPTPSTALPRPRPRSS